MDSTASPLSIQSKAALVLACAASYYGLFQLNLLLFTELEFANGVNWVFLPSGLRLLLVLVLAEYGALGLFLGSLFINYAAGSPTDHVFNWVTSLISGFSPYLARGIALDKFHLDIDLHHMSGRVFFKITLLFALISATLHQLWFFWLGHSSNFVVGTLVMFIGDWLGTALVLAFAHLVVLQVRKFIHLR